MFPSRSTLNRGFPIAVSTGEHNPPGLWHGRHARRSPCGLGLRDRTRKVWALSTGVVESTVKQIVSKRMVKQQQMRWSPRGAHLLLQVRTQVLNEDLHTTSHRWYPTFDADPKGEEAPQAA
jgi:hypothetical protein